MGFLEFTGLDKVLPVALGGKPKMDAPALTAQNFQPAPAPAPAPSAPTTEGMGQLGGRHRRRSHKRRPHRKTKKHSRR